eukprot:CAMPEP_0204545666 /NCGR_PEP_ID=MMETSP0661-20131031/21439_1 /ASSEMBLY_ACC=CAM_ASM_000606 /TAXON_ID=109239 /ORGANISM="Alexandrium margalefi, Strain AMGDE01CS-322" /LENGTH=102 /DNA_ID=CAMNT_0051552463 /DNA_START=62 /DNA_END=367 /DNA_ORIENTATION=-
MARHCVEAYRERTGRLRAREDPYSYGISKDSEPELVESSGATRPFVGSDMRRLLRAVYDCMVPHAWARGDALVVDNVRWAHARLDGFGPARRVHFAWYGFPN